MATTFTVPVTPGSPDGDPTYADRMIAKAEGRPYVPGEQKPAENPADTTKQSAAEPAKSEEPDYKKLYEELKAKQETPPEKKEGDQQADQQTPEEKAAVEALADKGLNLADFTKEFQETGELSEASYKKLEEKGIDKATVDAYIEGQKALAEAWTNKIFSFVDGPDRYSEMLNWAKDNLTKEQIQAYNDAVTSSDKAQAELAVKGLHAQFTENVGKPPQALLNGGPGGGTSGDVFASKAEMTAAMRDPRYDKDPAYREAVVQKTLRSKLF